MALQPSAIQCDVLNTADKNYFSITIIKHSEILINLTKID